MPSAMDCRHARIHPAVVVAGITLGILLLFSLHFAIPYLLGPLGLVAVVLLDVLIYLWIRRRRLVRKRPWKYSHIVWGPVDRRYVSRAPHQLEAEFAATFLFVAFLLGIYVIGTAIRVESWWIAPDVDLYVFGSIMTSLAFRILLVYRADPLQSESEKFDTTKDH